MKAIRYKFRRFKRQHQQRYPGFIFTLDATIFIAKLLCFVALFALIFYLTRR